MRRFTSIIFLLLSALSLYAVTVPVSQAKMSLTKVPNLQNELSDLQVAADTFCYFLEQGTYQLNDPDSLVDFVVITTPSQRILYPDPNVTMPELSYIKNQKRMYRMGDSIVIVILDQTNTIMYTKKISDIAYGTQWRRTQYVGHLIDSTTWNVKFSDTSKVTSITRYTPNAKGWTIANGVFVKNDSSLVVPSITLFGLPEADFKGNLWAYGSTAVIDSPGGSVVTRTDTVLVKYEQISKQAFYYNPFDPIYKPSQHLSFTNRILNRNLSQNLSSGIVYKYPNFYTCTLGDKPYIVPSDTVILSSTQTLASGSYQAIVRSPILVKDDINTQFYYTNLHPVTTLYQVAGTPSINSNSFVMKYTIGSQPKTMNTLTYTNNAVVRNTIYDTTSYGMSDTLPFKIYFLSNTIKIDSVKDTTVDVNATYSRTFNIRNCVGLLQSITSLPSWLKLELVSEVPFSTTPSVDQGMKTYKLSGTPPADSTYSINIGFLDTILNCKGYYSSDSNTIQRKYQTCNLIYKITAKASVSVRPIVKTEYTDFIKVTNNQIQYGLKISSNVSIQVFNLLGRQIMKMQKFENAGIYSIKINTSNENLIYRINAGSKQLTKLVTVCK